MRWPLNFISGLKSDVSLDPENFDDSAVNKIFVAYAHAQNDRISTSGPISYKTRVARGNFKKLIFTYLLTTRWLRNSISGLKSAVFLDPENFDDSAVNKISVAYAHAQNGRISTSGPRLLFLIKTRVARGNF